jgi:nucleotide-binding universal stress UspA family protein
MSFPPKHILVPVDVDVVSDRELTAHLVDVAADFAKMSAAKITLAHVAVPVVPSATPPLDNMSDAYRAMADVLEARNAAAGKLLSELKERVASKGVLVDAQLIAKPGSVPEAIVDAATALGVDLIMIASHSRRGLRRLVLGSVAERTAHLSSIPVLLIPAG